MVYYKYDVDFYIKVFFLYGLFIDRVYILNFGDLLECWSNGLFK